MLVGEYEDSIGRVHSGYLAMDSVEFRFCGQGGYHSPQDPRYALVFQDSFFSSTGSYVRKCSFHHGYNTAIGIHTANNVEITRNVILRTTGSGVKIGGRGNKVTENLGLMTTTVQPNNPRDNHAVDFPATFDIDGGNTLIGNAAAGSTRLGFRFAGEPCLEGNIAPVNDAVSLLLIAIFQRLSVGYPSSNGFIYRYATYYCSSKSNVYI